MEKFSFFNDVNDDRVYYAEDWARHLKKYFTNGIFNNELNVVANDDMTITIKEGDANIEGYRYTNTGDLVKTIEMADGTLNRIDNVVLRLDLTNRLISAQIIKGTFADKPVAPELVRTSTIYDLRLAKISIPAGTTTITQDLITDTRFITSDCGNVISTVQTPDTENLFIQMQTLFEKQINELNNNFETWFDSMKNQLSSDAAGNLQNQINNLNSNKADNATYDPNFKNLQLSANGEKIGDSVHIPTGITDEIFGEEDLKIINNRGVAKFSLEGKTEQKSYEGKNLLNYIDNLQSVSGLTSTINSDDSITTTGKITADYTSIIKSINVTSFLEDGQKYTISQKYASTKLYLVITATRSDGTYIQYNSGFNVSSTFIVNKSIYKTYTARIQTTTMEKFGDSSLTITNKYMLCKGTDTVNTSFEPYCGGQASPSPDYPQKINNVRGVENIWFGGDSVTVNGVTFTKNADGSYDITGTATSEANCYNFMDIANTKLKNGINYIISINKLTDTNVGILTEAYAGETWLKHIIGGINTKTDLLSSKTVIVEDNITRIRYGLRVTKGTTVDVKGLKIQLEEGQIAHDYVPYRSNYLQLKNTTDNESKIINIDLKGNELCSNKEQTLKDELIIENGRAKIIKKYDEVILTGSEDIGYYGKYGSHQLFYYDFLGDSNYKNNNKVIALCNQYKCVSDTNNAMNVMKNFEMRVREKDGRLYWQDDRYNNTSDMKSWLSNNNMVICYELAEPQTIDLGEVDLDLLEGNSTLNVEEELKSNMSIKYYTDSTVVDLKNEVVKKQNKVLSGTTVPNQSLGEDGDIYFQYGS